MGLSFLVGLFGVMQLIPYGRHHTNPPVIQEPAWDTPRTRELAVRACFDCHSNETTWPLYSRIAPVSWLVTFDVIRGRNEFNLSEWNGPRERGEGERGEGGGDEIREVIAEGKMPPANFLILHPEARLTSAEKEQLITGLEASLR